MSDVQDTTTDQQTNANQGEVSAEAQEAQQDTTHHEEETAQANESEQDNFDVEKELKKLRKESAARRTSPVSYTHLTLPTTPYV